MLAAVVSFLGFGAGRTANTAKLGLGMGYDISQVDLWRMTGFENQQPIFGFGVEACLQTAAVPHQSDMAVKTFKNTHDISQYFSSENTFSMGASAHDLSGSIKSASGVDSSRSWFLETSGSIAYTKNVQRTHVLKATCSQKLPLHPTFRSRLQSLPLDPIGNNESTMNKWHDLLSTFGTHVSFATFNGAMMRYSASIQTSGSSQDDCLHKNTCAAANSLNFSIDACAGSSACQLASQFDGMWQSQCVVVGGNSNYSTTELCDPSTSPEVREAFMRSGDLDAAESVIQMSFQRLDSVVGDAGYHEQAVTLEKAIEYHLCLGASDVWQWSIDDKNASCKCKFQCDNDNPLDDGMCTCSCRGDLNHGWKGSSCSDTYGSCQPGPGCGNTDACNACPQNNQCRADFNEANCKPTDNCCANDFHVACCPFGSSCNCGATGNCQCVPPP